VRPERDYRIGAESAPGDAESTAERLTITAARSNHGYAPFYDEGPIGPKSFPENGDAQDREPGQGTHSTPQDTFRA